MKRAAPALTLSSALLRAGAPTSGPTPAPSPSGQDSVPDSLLTLMADAHGGSDRIRGVRALRMDGALQTREGEDGPFLYGEVGRILIECAPPGDSV